MSVPMPMYGNNQQGTSIGREENNSADVCHLSQPSPSTISTTMSQLSANTLPTARLQAQSFEEVAKQSQSKGNLQANYGNYCKQYSHLVKSRKSDDAYTWRCYGIGNRRRSFYKCAHPGCPATKSVDRSLDGQIIEIIHKARHNHPESQLTRTSSLSAFSQIIRASNHLTIKIPEQSYVTYEGVPMDPEAASVVLLRSVLDKEVGHSFVRRESLEKLLQRRKERTVKTNSSNIYKVAHKTHKEKRSKTSVLRFSTETTNFREMVQRYTEVPKTTDFREMVPRYTEVPKTTNFREMVPRYTGVPTKEVQEKRRMAELPRVGSLDLA
ncbi:probable WRKY transcription factor 34 [Herrania umbratica]|uniref:Probable WRKY transcription factor 34 n=1 Tax=Herrania umbratica TaxID=108875 RepID=A0A6J1AHD9_9ROSI|nr:probable WRKY transcription factor 34 [Herrania umbratica]